MKRLLILFLLLTNITYAQVVQEYEFLNPQFSSRGQFHEIHFENTLLTASAGQAALPYQAVSLLLPEGQKAASIEVILYDKVELDGAYLLKPAQASRPLSQADQGDISFDANLYKSTEIYPSQPYGHLTTEILHGHRIAMSSFSPLEYIPAEKKVSYYKRASVIIHTEDDTEYSHTRDMVRTDAFAINAIKKIVQNFDQIPAYAGKSSFADKYELLIITPQSFSEGFEALQAYYLTKGIRSELVTKEFITSNQSGDDLQEKMRNYIIDAYQNNGIESVLLGGDVEHIPYRGFYCYVQSGSGYSSSNIPADLYFSALDGTWNDNGNNYWGEPDEADLLPEIGIGRMPFSNTTEFDNLLNKTILYQTEPVLGDFQKPLLVGENLYYGPETWGRDYLELLIGTRDDNGYTTTGIPEDYDIQRMYEYDYYWSKSQLISAINQGVQYVHHVGHASETYVSKMTNSDITNSNFNQVNGITKNFTIFHTHGCDCGAFDYNDCILERMVNIENFAVAVVGNSRYGWFNEGQTEGPAAHLHREMTDAQFDKRIGEIGEALSEGKRQTAPWVTAPGQWEEGALRWNFYDLNVLGDPFLSIWIDEPYSVSASYQSEVFVGSPELEVAVLINGSPAPAGYRVSVVKDDEIIAAAFTEADGNALIIFEEVVAELGDAKIIISGYNIFPEEFELLFIASSGPHVVYESHIIDDSGPDGNGNGIPEYQETVYLELTVENIGVENAQNVQVVLSSDDEYVSIYNAESTVPQIGAGQTAAVSDAFIVSFSKDIPDQHKAKFHVECSDGANSWTSSFNVNVSAAILAIGDYVLDDSAGGNGNGRLDPGETVFFDIEIHNSGHSATHELKASLAVDSDYVTISNEMQTIGILDKNSTESIRFEIHISNDVPAGTAVILSMRVWDNVWDEIFADIFPIGLQIEDFETGDFEAFEWNQSGNVGWIVTPVNPYEGNYSARSGEITHNQKSELWISFISISDGSIGFARKVSSEKNYDQLKFYVNDVMKMQWSGEEDWEMVHFDVPEGQNTVRWSYTKDYMVSSGSDAAWIDNIVFPFTTILIDLQENRLLNSVDVSPNPGNGLFYISGLQDDAISLELFDMAGKKVFDYKGETISHLQLENLENGVYILQIVQKEKIFRSRLIISK